jgi:hypothetical protein
VACEPTVRLEWEEFTSEGPTPGASLFFDTLWISPPAVLGKGNFQVQGQKIIFADTQKANLYLFDKEGNFERDALGLGDSPQQVQGLEYFVPINEQAFFIISSFLIYYFPSLDGWASYSLMDFRGEKSREDLLRNPQGEDWEIYQPNWNSMPVNFYGQQDSILFFPIITEHPDLNAYQHKRFYRETKTIAKLDALSGKLLDIGGEWPEVYLDQAFIPNLAYTDVFIHKGKVYCSFHADASIYVYDLDFNPLFKFGKAMKNGEAKFQRYSAGWDAVDAWDYDLRVNPLYASIYADEDYVFRIGLPKGIEQNGVLQIYNQEDFSLVAEVDIPYRFRVIGKIGDHYFADGILEDKSDQVGIFKFKIQ